MNAIQRAYTSVVAALYLKPLDDAMHRLGFYARFMDDWLMMVKTKHQLRKIIKVTHRVLNQLKLTMHPDKTFLGCVKSLDFIALVQPKKAYLTHISYHLGFHDEVQNKLPDTIHLAYDNLEINLL